MQYYHLTSTVNCSIILLESTLSMILQIKINRRLVMYTKMNLLAAFYFTLMLVVPVSLFAAPETGETISKQGVVSDDFYALAGTVNMDADVAGDVIVTGGDLRIEHRIAGDVTAAGGTVNVRGEMLDDVRIIGGEIHVNANIGDDLFAAGGKIDIAPNTSIKGDTLLAGGNISMAGTAGELYIAGGKILISGKVHGNVKIEGGEIEILDGAVIDGNLFYKSTEEVKIHSGAIIKGKTTYEHVEREAPHKGYGFFFVVTMIVSSIALFLLFPNFTMSAAGRIHSEALKSLGLGFALFVAVPAAAILLISLLVSLWIGLCLLALYLVMLHVSLLISFFFLGDWAAKLLHKDVTSTGRRILSVTITIILLGLIQMIPVIGGLLIFVLMLLGLGAGVMQLQSVYGQAK